MTRTTNTWHHLFLEHAEHFAWEQQNECGALRIPFVNGTTIIRRTWLLTKISRLRIENQIFFRRIWNEGRTMLRVYGSIFVKFVNHARRVKFVMRQVLTMV